MHRVFLVDDHELVRRAIVDLLADEPDLQVVGEASTAADALARIPTLDVDVVVLDAHLPDRSATDLSKDLMAQVPGVACLLLVPTLDDPAVLEAVVAGVYGAVPKTSTADVLTTAVRAAGEGDTTATLLFSMLREVGEHQRKTVTGKALDQLTARERQILALHQPKHPAKPPIPRHSKARPATTRSDTTQHPTRRTGVRDGHAVAQTGRRRDSGRAHAARGPGRQLRGRIAGDVRPLRQPSRSGSRDRAVHRRRRGHLHVRAGGQGVPSLPGVPAREHPRGSADRSRACLALHPRDLPHRRPAPQPGEPDEGHDGRQLVGMLLKDFLRPQAMLPWPVAVTEANVREG